jgi:hypothetical protein
MKKSVVEFGYLSTSSYISSVIREIDMKRELFLEGIGWVLETTYFRLNSDNVVEPYTEYEILKPL